MWLTETGLYDRREVARNRSGARPVGRSCAGWSGATRGPAGEQDERVLGRATRFGQIGDQAGRGAGLEGKRLEGQVEVADDRMTQPLDAGAVDADVVGGPAESEVLAASGQLAHQIGEPPVVWIATGFGTEQGDRVVGHGLPVAEQRDRTRIEEDQPGVVHRLACV